MAWVEISPWGNTQIFASRSAAGKSLGYARTALKIYIEVEEVKASSLFTSLQIELRKLIVLFTELWNILVLKCVPVLRLSNNRLYRNLLKSKICQMLNIL